MQDVSKGSIVACGTETFEFKKLIETKPIQDLYLRPEYTFAQLLDDVDKISGIEEKVEKLENENAKLREALGYCFDAIEMLINSTATNAVEYESILNRLRNIGGNK